MQFYRLCVTQANTDYYMKNAFVEGTRVRGNDRWTVIGKGIKKCALCR